MKGKNVVLFGLMAIILGFAVWDSVAPPKHYEDDAPRISVQNAIVPNPEFTTLDGTKHRLHDFEGKIVLLNFWATWCQPCIVEFPQLLELADRYKYRIVLVAISVDEKQEKITPFFTQFDEDVQKRTGLENVLIAHDPDKKISQDLFQTVIYPETYIIGENLVLKQKIAGIFNAENAEIRSLIEKK